MKFTKSIQTSDLKLFGSLEEAQKHELTLLFDPSGDKEQADFQAIAETLLAKQEQVIDILTTTERSRPSSRKINGATRKRKPKAAESVEG